jgi:hypothetical protein
MAGVSKITSICSVKKCTKITTAEEGKEEGGKVLQRL